MGEPVPPAEPPSDLVTIPTTDPRRYTSPESIWEALEKKDVRLVKSSWIEAHSETGEPLPRRQELPEEAFITVEELKRQYEHSQSLYDPGKEDDVVPIVGISFCWDTPPHPDPRGMQLATVAAALKREMPKYVKFKDVFGEETPGFTDMGVFWGAPAAM